jgi:glycosyltransferase involved in cell wall biosynthesis
MSTNTVFNPKVSIIIPVYNGAKYMRESIDSAINQNYKNIEIIVVNDGSNDQDKTHEIALSYGDKIRYFEKENGGVATALNLGIKEMTGEYFSWLSHDDVYYPYKIKTQIECLAKLDNKNTILYSCWELINYQSQKTHEIDLNNFPLEQLHKPLYPLLNGIIHGCSLLIPVICFKEIGVFDKSLKTTQDYNLWFKFLRKFPVCFNKEILIKSRVHNEQTSKKIKNFDEENKLWIGIINSITEDEAKYLYGDFYHFYENTANFLEKTPYQDAYEYCLIKKQKIIDLIKVSIIIPFFNRVDLTRNAIKSALQQTHKNIEIILVDDGSTEEIGEILDFQTKYNNIIYIKQSNLGAASARNKGIKFATGEYIAFLDSDDVFLPNKISFQVYQMKRNNYCVSYTSYRTINQDGNSNLHDVYLLYKDEKKVFPKIISTCAIATPTIMLKATIINKEEGIFDENILDGGEDVIAWINLAEKYDFLGIEDVLSVVNIDEANSSAYNNHKLSCGMINIFKYVVKQYHSSCDDSIKENIKKLYFSLGLVVFSDTIFSEITEDKSLGKSVISHENIIFKSKKNRYIMGIWTAIKFILPMNLRKKIRNIVYWKK